MTNKKGTATLSSYSYTYYLDGNQRTKTDVVNNRTTTYGYDLAGRLTSESESGGNTYAYTYDSRNNRTKMTVSGDESYSVAYEYDEDNRLLTETKTIDGKQEITRYSYDGNGNQILKTQSVLKTAGSGTAGASLQVSASEPVEFDATVSEYNGWNQQVKVTNDAGTSSYAYYPDGMRYSKTVNGTLLRQVWDGTNLAYEYTLDEEEAVVPVRRYARGINAIYVESGDAKSYYLYNAHGDVVQLTDATGTVTQEYEYDAFGNEQNPDAGDANPLRYCGEYFDAETGTIYLRARYYDPRIGRFTSADSFLGNANDPLSLNRYTYCYNNPLLWIDPTGHWVESDSDFSTTVQIELLKLTLAWHLAEDEETRNDLHNQAEAIRQQMSSGWGWLVDNLKTVSGVLADDSAWFLGGDTSRAERDYWLSEVQKYDDTVVVKEKVGLQFAVALAGIIVPSPEDAAKYISKQASKDMIKIVGEKESKKFLRAITKFAGKTGSNGIKKLAGNGIDGFMYEAKVISKSGGAYRLLGNLTESGEIFWEVFQKTH